MMQWLCDKCGNKETDKQIDPIKLKLHITIKSDFFKEQTGEVAKFEICSNCYKEIANWKAVPSENEEK